MKAHFMGISSNWNPESPSQAKVGKFDGPLFVDEEILWLHVTM